MYVKTTRFCSWLLVGLVAAAVGCGSGAGGAPGQTGGSGSGGVSASGGRDSSGGAGGTGGSTPATGPGGATGSGGGANSSGGQFAGGATGSSATGGKAAGGSAGATAAQTGGSSGAGGVATGGVPATGGQGSGGKNAGGSTGAGGAATGGSGAGGRATGGSGGGGSATGGASELGGSAAGGASGTGGKTGNPDASTSGYHPCPTDGTACKIMPFGDSITDGYNQDTPGGYRVELFRLAHSAGKNITFVGTGSNGPSTVDGVSFPPHHEGHSGWTIYPEGGRKGISECLQASSDCLSSNSVMPEYTPHVVLLMIGTNDAIDNYDMGNAPTRLGKLIDTIYDQLPNVLIVVAQPIPSRGDASKGDDTALSGRIKTYDDAIPAVVQARADAGKHILLVDMFTPFNPNKASLIEDQWHPNLQGYVLLATQWYSVLKSLL
jgi:lysophospholipase L1-like esterase